jgi:hypothetical protein
MNKYAYVYKLQSEFKENDLYEGERLSNKVEEVKYEDRYNTIIKYW